MNNKKKKNFSVNRMVMIWRWRVVSIPTAKNTGGDEEEATHIDTMNINNRNDNNNNNNNSTVS